MAESILVTIVVIAGVIVLLPAVIIFAVTSVMLLTILFSVGFGAPVVLGQELKKRIESLMHRKQALQRDDFLVVSEYKDMTG